jgi:ribosomal protein S4E
MTNEPPKELRNGEHCLVVAGTHAGKSGTVMDMKTSKTGYVTITVLQANGVRFKTLGRNVVLQAKPPMVGSKPPTAR